MEDDYEELKKEVLMMIINYWAIDNNNYCEQATLLFLRKNKMLDEFNEHKELDVQRVSKEIKDDYEENLRWFNIKDGK